MSKRTSPLSDRNKVVRIVAMTVAGGLIAYGIYLWGVLFGWWS